MNSRLPKSLVDACNTTPAAPDDDDATGSTDTRRTRAKGTRTGRKTRDRFGVLNAFVDFTAATLTRGELLVWLVLYRDTKDGTAATSQADIARRAGLCKRTVISALQRLESAGLLKRIHRGGLRRGTSRYRVFGLRNDKL